MNFDYKSRRWEELRKRALQRDGYHCTMCGHHTYGKKRGSRRPIVDHIQTVKDRPDLAWELSNLRTLCSTCDNQRHREKGMTIKDESLAVGIDGLPIDPSNEWSN